MNKSAVFVVLFLLVCTGSPLYAQNDKTKEEKVPVFNYVIDDALDKFQAIPDTAAPVFYHYVVPDFYFHKPRKVLDTTYEFFCYDAYDSVLDVITDYDSVLFYSLYKSYTDSAHTYIDKDGEKQFIPVASIVKRYDKTGPSKWMTIEYPGNKYGELREFKNVIIGTDTEKVWNAHGDNIYTKIYHRYKLLK